MKTSRGPALRDVLRHVRSWQTPRWATASGAFVVHHFPAVGVQSVSELSPGNLGAISAGIAAVDSLSGIPRPAFTVPKSYSADGTYLVPTWSLLGGWAYLPGSLPGTHLAPTWYLGAYLDPGVTARFDIL